MTTVPKMPMHTGRASWARWIATVLAVFGLSSFGMVVGLEPVAAAYPLSSVSLMGHGWGSGRGMGQWGALGYALQGWSYQQILEHFYGGTSMSMVGNPDIRVVITENDGNSVAVSSESPFSVAGISFAGGQAALMAYAGAPGQFDVFQGSSCDATTASSWSEVGTASNPVAVPSTQSQDAGTSQLLELCQGGGNRYYRGSIQAYDDDGSTRTINIVPLESYVQGVVPAESPAYWGTLGPSGPQGEPQGFQELEAQAVAARSYVMSSLGEFGYADICDTSQCQEYPGVTDENQLTDLAVADTAGEVLVMGNGSVARTEYSSSTGGYTAGGAFPAVVDAGDSVCVPSACNENHLWHVQVPVSAIQAAYPSIGTLSALDVTARNGYGDWGGRVEEMTVQGSAGSVQVTGDEFAADLGLLSNWFTVTSTPSGGVEGYWEASSSGSVYAFGDAPTEGSLAGTTLPSPIVAMAADPSGKGYWLAGANGSVYAFGFTTSAGGFGPAGIHHVATSIAATPNGHGYLVAARGGSVESFGDAPQFGDAAENPTPPSAPIIAVVAYS